MAKHKRVEPRSERVERIRRRIPKAKAEPALLRGVIVGLLALLAGSGVTWATDLRGNEVVVGFLVSIGALLLHLLQAWLTRPAVTPNAKVVSRVSTTTGLVVPGEAAPLVEDPPAPHPNEF